MKPKFSILEHFKLGVRGFQNTSILKTLTLAPFLFAIVSPCYSDDIVDRGIFRKTLRDYKAIDSIKVFKIDDNCFYRVIPLENDTSYCAGLQLIEGYPAVNPVTVIDKPKIRKVTALLKRELVDPPTDAVLCEYRIGAIITYSLGKAQAFEFDDIGKYLVTKINNTKLFAYTKSDIWQTIQKELHVKYSTKRNSYCSD